jgi:hypothetical protein
MRQTISILVPLAVLLCKASGAEACTAPPYEDVFVPSGTAPVDGFAAEIGDPGRSLPMLVDDTGLAVELVTTSGPGTRWTVKPAKALVPGGHYSFRFQLGRRLDPTDTVPQSIDLTASPAAPLPVDAGTLRVETDALTTSPTFHVEWDRAPALQAYSSLLETHFLIDGMPLSDLERSQSGQSFSAVCDRQQPTRDSCGEVEAVPAGRHTVTLTARLFGSAAPLPELSTVIDVHCPTAVPLGNDSYDPDGGACAVAGRSADAGLVGLGAALGLLLVRRRSR